MKHAMCVSCNRADMFQQNPLLFSLACTLLHTKYILRCTDLDTDSHTQRNTHNPPPDTHTHTCPWDPPPILSTSLSLYPTDKINTPETNSLCLIWSFVTIVPLYLVYIILSLQSSTGMSSLFPSSLVPLSLQRC